MKLAKYITIPAHTEGEFRLPSDNNITKICLKAFKSTFNGYANYMRISWDLVITSEKWSQDNNSVVYPEHVNDALIELTKNSITIGYDYPLFSETSMSPCYIGSFNKTGDAVNIEYCKIYDGEELLYNYVACVDDKGQACLYDTISKTYLYDSNKVAKMLHDFSTVTAIEIPEGKVAKIEDKEGNVLWNSYPDPAKYAYGIR